MNTKQQQQQRMVGRWWVGGWLGWDREVGEMEALWAAAAAGGDSNNPADLMTELS